MFSLKGKQLVSRFKRIRIQKPVRMDRLHQILPTIHLWEMVIKVKELLIKYYNVVIQRGLK